jgi:APA family basic amino acid/polyamine antiporter
VIVLRFRRPELPRPFRTWGYPATPILFLTVSAWMMFWSMRARPLESCLAFLTVLAGGLVFWWTTRRGSAPRST